MTLPPSTFSEVYLLITISNIIGIIRDAPVSADGFKYLSVTDVQNLFKQGFSIKEVWGLLNNAGNDDILTLLPNNQSISGLNSSPRPFAPVKTFMSAISATGSTSIVDEIFALKINSALSTYEGIMTYWATGANATNWTPITTNDNTIFDFSVQNCYDKKQVLSYLISAPVSSGNSYAWLKSVLTGILHPNVSLYAAFTSMIPVSLSTGPSSGALYENANFVLSDLLEIVNQNVRNSDGTNFVSVWDLIRPYVSGTSGTRVATNSLTESQALAAFNRVKSHGFLQDDIFKSTLWRTDIVGLGSSTQSRLLINAFDKAYGFLATSTLHQRLSWFEVFKAQSTITVGGITTVINANLSTLEVALVMLQTGDSLDDIFTYLTSSKSSVNTAWKTVTYTKKDSNANDFNSIKTLTTFINFSADTFTSAVNIIVFFRTARTTISGTSFPTSPTDNLLKIVASGFGNNSSAFTQAAGVNPPAILFSYVTGVSPFSYASSNLPLTLNTVTITLASSASVSTFLSYVFGGDVSTYLKSNLTSVTINYSASPNTSLVNNFSIAFSDSTKVNESVDLVLKTVPVSEASVYGAAPTANMLSYALSLTTDLGSKIIERVISLAKTDSDHDTIHSTLDGTSLYNRMVAGKLTQVNVANIYNYVAKFSSVAAAMTSTPATSQVLTATKVNGFLDSLRTGAFPAYAPLPASPTLPGSVYNTSYETVSNTKLLSAFYGALDNNTVNTVLRSLNGNYNALAAGSWLNYFKKPVNIGTSITGFNATNSNGVDYVGYLLTNIFTTTMLYPTYSFNFDTGVQSSSVTYVQVVSGSKAVELGYAIDDVKSIINAPPL